jgi:hypothetical protein
VGAVTVFSIPTSEIGNLGDKQFVSVPLVLVPAELT